jgi:transposase
MENTTVSHKLGVHAMAVDKWHRRFRDQRVARLSDEPRPNARVEAAITRTLEGHHWSSPARRAVSTVQRIWRALD